MWQHLSLTDIPPHLVITNTSIALCVLPTVHEGKYTIFRSFAIDVSVSTSP